MRNVRRKITLMLATRCALCHRDLQLKEEVVWAHDPGHIYSRILCLSCAAATAPQTGCPGCTGTAKCQECWSI